MCYGGSVSWIAECLANSAASLFILVPLYIAGATGGGDIKLLAALGGLLGAETAIKTAVIALVIAALYGMPVMIKRRDTRMHKIHFSYAIFVALIISVMRTQIVF